LSGSPRNTPFVDEFVSLTSLRVQDANFLGGYQRRWQMTNKQALLALCTAMALSASAANAGPCNTPGKDAGSGPTPGYTGQSITTGEADVKAHPPTGTMNQVAGDKATSEQDAQRQQQGQPTAAQQAQGAKQTQTADQGC
jgi:hypothetical protein